MIDNKDEIERLKKEVWYLKQKTVPSLQEQIDIISGDDSLVIPTKTSDLTNDSGFITNQTNSLANYYLKSEAYNKTEVNNLFSDKGVKELSTEYIRITDLDTGIYKLTYNGAKYIYYWGATDTVSTHRVQSENGQLLLFVNKYEFNNETYWHWNYFVGQNSYGYLVYGFTSTTFGQCGSKSLSGIITKSDVQNNLNYSTSNNSCALSAYQGYVLKGLIVGLENSKQNTLSQAQQDAVDSGIDSAGVGQITTNKNDISDLKTDKADKSEIPSKMSDLANDSGFVTSSALPTALSDLSDDSTHRLVTDSEKSAWSGKQNALTAGNNISISNNTISATDTTYTAGTNVTINGNVISAVDTKYTAGTNVTIDSNNVISANMSGAITTDVQINGTSVTNNGVANIKTNTAYNASTNKIATMSDVPIGLSEISSQYIRITDLDTGVYKLTYNGKKYLYYNGSTATDAHEIVVASGAVILVVNKYWSMTTWRHWFYISGSDSKAKIYYGSTSGSSGSVGNKTLSNLSDFSGSYNDLTNKPTIPTALSALSDDSSHRLTSDNEKTTWNNKMTLSGYSACLNVGTSYGQGYIDYKYGSTTFRHAFGVANVNGSISFSSPFSTIIWATATDASQSDAQSQRTTLSSISTTGLSFKGGAAVPARWEAWGIL